MSADPPKFLARPDLADALEAERRRIASEVQTRILDQARLILAQVGFYEQAAAEGSPAQMQFGVLSALLRQLLESARDLDAALYPALLDSAGLGPALESLLAQTRRSSGLQSMLLLPRPFPALSSQQERFLYRAAQDVLAQAAQVRAASRLWLIVRAPPGQILCRFEDDGQPPQSGALAQLEAYAASLGYRVSSGPHEGGWALELALPAAAEALTGREVTVMQGVVAGLSNKQIAQRLQIQPRTVKFHLDNVYSKLGVATRTEAAIIALQRGWVAPE